MGVGGKGDGGMIKTDIAASQVIADLKTITAKPFILKSG